MRSVCIVVVLVVMLTPATVLAANRQRGYLMPTVKPVYKPATSLIESLEDWTRIDGKPVAGWEIVDGSLHRQKKTGGIHTAKQYSDFALDFSWTIAKGGNSGIKYKYAPYDVGGWLGCEYQILDDPNNAEGNSTKHETGSLYDIVAPAVSPSPLNPTGEANTGRIVAHGGRIQHYLNDVKVVDIRVGSPEWKERLEDSKFRETSDFGAIDKGHIMVQDHGAEVWLHELNIREIVPATFWTFISKHDAKKHAKTKHCTQRRACPTTRVARGR